MKNIQIFDGAVNAVYDIFAATDDEFALIFPAGTDVAFIDEVYQQQPPEVLKMAFSALWGRRYPRAKRWEFTAFFFTKATRRSLITLPGVMKRPSIRTGQDSVKREPHWGDNSRP